MKKPGKYQDLAKELVKSIEKRDGKITLDKEHQDRTKEAMFREGICQIIAKEKLLRKISLLLLIPELIIPYFFRIR